MTQSDVVPERTPASATDHDDRAAWRDLVIRMQTRLDSADGANAGYLVDFALAALGRAAREQISLADALGTGEATETALAWYGLKAFADNLIALAVLDRPDEAEERLVEARTAYRQRGWIDRVRTRFSRGPDPMLRAVTLAEDRVKVRDFVLRECDIPTRLVWALFTLQTLCDTGGIAGGPAAFVDRLDVDIPEHRLYLDQPGFARLLAAVAELPSDSLADNPRRLQRRRRIREC